MTSSAKPATSPKPSMVEAGASHYPKAEAAPAITVEKVSKSFFLPRHRPSTLKERVLHPFHGRQGERLHALRDVSFSVKQGEFFGIVGRNGSGKSTLLKLLAGIYRPDGGKIEVAGLISPFIELGVGFNPELTARDNVIINASLFGISRSEALRRFDAIVEFAELEDFVDLRLKNYSSGMQVRLGFATAIQIDADVLLLDEVLAVGDAGFQEKCFEVFRRYKREGKTLVLVTHDLNAVERFCDRAMLLQRGERTALGSPDEIVHTYQQLTEAAVSGSPGAWQETNRWGDGSAEILDAWFQDSRGNRAEQLDQGEPTTFVCEVLFHQAMVEPILGLSLSNEDDRNVFVTNTLWAKVPTGNYEPGERAKMEIRFDNWLATSRYFASPAVAHRDATRMADWREQMISVLVKGRRWTGGAIDPPHKISIERT